MSATPPQAGAVAGGKRPPQVTGNVGLYYTCFRLSLHGWNAMPTARNARGVDIIAYDDEAKSFVGIQVKTLTRRNPVPLGTSLHRVMGDFWVIVTEIDLDRPRAFVLHPAEVISLAHRGIKDDRVSFWLPPKAYEADHFREAWHRLRESNGPAMGTD